jgi:putative MATE family efflux protein
MAPSSGGSDPMVPQPAGAPRDLTRGRVTGQVLRLAAFTGGEVGLFGLMPLILAYWTGKVSSHALAGVALGTSLYVVLTSVCRGVSLAGMALVAQRIGSNDRQGAERALMQTLLVLTALCVALGAAGIIWGRTLLTWMGATGGLLDASYDYLRATMFGLLAMEALPCIDNLVRGAGYAEYTLVANLVTVVVMLAAVPLLVLGWGALPALGAAGAGWGMAIGGLAGAGVLLVVLARGSAGIGLRATALAPDWRLLGQIASIGLPATLQRLSLNLANALFMTLVTSLGETVLLAYSVVNRVTGFLMCPVTGVGMATATLVGQNLGAARLERAEQIIRQSLLAALGCAALLIGLLNLLPRATLGLFTNDAEAIGQGLVAARFMLYIGLLSAANQVLSGALTGAGRTLAPMLANAGAQYLVQLPIAWLLVRAAPIGPTAVWVALAIGQTVASAALALVIRRGVGRGRTAPQVAT